jgi:hypothetical protein
MLRAKHTRTGAKQLRRLALGVLLPSACLALASAVPGTASAQIRTGGTERILYENDLATQRHAPRSGQPSTNTQRVPARTQARTVGSRGTYSSILEQESAQSVPATPTGPTTPPATPIPSRPAPAAGGAAPHSVPAEIYLSPSDEFYDEQYVDDGHYTGDSGCGCASCSGARFGHVAPGAFGRRDLCGDTCGPLLGDPCLGPLARLASRLSVRAELPLFWRQSQVIPALVTSAPAGTASNLAGRADQATTQFLLGPGKLEEDNSTGVRITVGTWIDDCEYRGVLARYTNAGKQTQDFLFSSNQLPILARPFTNISTGTATPDTQLVAYPGLRNGNIQAQIQSEVDAFDIVMRRQAYQDRFTRFDWLVGYQHNSIDETLLLRSVTNITGGNPALVGSSIEVTDLFATENSFNGAVLGFMSTRQFACWQFETMFRMGLGNLQRSVSASGTTSTRAANGTVSTDLQGLLARDTNNRPITDSTFVVSPEVGVNAAYKLTRNLDATIGYNFLLMPKVAQVGRQVDSTVNLNDPLTGALRPRLNLVEQNFQLHALNFGLQWRY